MLRLYLLVEEVTESPQSFILKDLGEGVIK